MMIQRWLSKLRPFLNASSQSPNRFLFSSPFLHSSPQLHHHLHTFSTFNHLQSLQPYPKFNLGFQSITPLSVFRLNQCRYVSKAKERRLKKLTPMVSKLKKYKIKPYSSYKRRFRTLHDGQIRRWHEGKRHNAHLKSKISKRRLRLPALVHPAYARVMKKLNFYN
ncbi:hypothetical protein AQUCO_00500631v1 [Aquilegia coerulea]|uniref:50S ribosomal protein L35 n=1 Tax=Aquilegia coerulea TaxID=218851 RepID=A0A2G5ET03_AQUCA|nr:hypothetical protein AQUCO_00500631v1 [Aquilegia coerulea]